MAGGGRGGAAGGSRRERVPLRAVGWLTDEGPADGALPLAVQHAEAADVGARGHAGVTSAQHPGHVGPVAVTLAGLAQAPRFYAPARCIKAGLRARSVLPTPCALQQLSPAAE